MGWMVLRFLPAGKIDDRLTPKPLTPALSLRERGQSKLLNRVWFSPRKVQAPHPRGRCPPSFLLVPPKARRFELAEVSVAGPAKAGAELGPFGGRGPHSLSPWGEGWGEGGRCALVLAINHLSPSSQPDPYGGRLSQRTSARFAPVRTWVV